MPSLNDVARFLEAFAPRELAAEWDNTGLLLGDRTMPVERILTCLTVTPEVVAEAVSERASLIVSHHPILFRGAKALSNDTAEGRLLRPLLKHDIAVYSPHTSFDNCAGGINDQLAAMLELANVTPLRPRTVSRECKLVVFVPESDLAKVSDALFAAGAGVIGNYEQCGFRVPGTGTFFGNDSANPAVGAKGRREDVAELRFECRVPLHRLDAAIAAMRSAHSYEEPAFDVYPLAPLASGGEGRIGDREPIALEELAASLKAKLGVAVACGAAGEFLKDAIRAGADAFVTGEVRFHDCLAAEAAGVALILPGHYASERPAVEWLATRLGEVFNIPAWPSRHERDPLRTI